jgi:rubrerythrin
MQPFVASPRGATQKHNLACARCGYGIAVRVAPERCPMCQGAARWVHAASRPFGARRL